MNNTEDSIAVVRDIIRDVARIRDNVIALFQDKEKTLDQRWSIFLEAIPLLEIDNYSDGQIGALGLDSVYDEFYVERYQTRMYDDLDEQLRENIEDAVEDSDSVWNEAKHNYDDWREAVLNAGYGGFVNDW